MALEIAPRQAKETESRFLASTATSPIRELAKYLPPQTVMSGLEAPTAVYSSATRRTLSIHKVPRILLSNFSLAGRATRISSK